MTASPRHTSIQKAPPPEAVWPDEDREVPSFAAGDQVRHATFGEGRVLEVEGEGVRAVVTVQFAQGSERYTPLGEAVEWTKDPEPSAMRIGDLCPECGHASLLNVEGCRKCYSCGYSEC